MATILADGDAVYGLIYQIGQDPAPLKEESEQDQMVAVKALIKILNTGGWLAEFLNLRLPDYAEKCPPPLEVMYWLAEQAINFESDVEHAKDIQERYPEIFGIKPLKTAAKGAR